MPDTKTRFKILTIRTNGWANSPPPHTLHEIASQTHNFSGADLEYLCTQAHSRAIRRMYPQLYETYGASSRGKEPIAREPSSHAGRSTAKSSNPSHTPSALYSDDKFRENICVLPGDFFTALSEMKPSLHRVNSLLVPAPMVEGRTLLEPAIEKCLSILRAHSFIPGTDYTTRPETEEDVYGLSKWLAYAHTDANSHRYMYQRCR
jgi:SpoVK/Ycf46/Vps4 family AAA+-type ATPase